MAWPAENSVKTADPINKKMSCHLGMLISFLKNILYPSIAAEEIAAQFGNYLPYRKQTTSND